MKYFGLVFIILLVEINLYGVQKADSELEKKVVKKELIAQSTVSFRVRKYADGSVEWAPNGMQTLVAKEHVKVFNEQALKKLPRHLHKAHKEHMKNKSDDEETVSLSGLTLSSLGFHSAAGAVAGSLIMPVFGVVASVVTGDVPGVVSNTAQFGMGLYAGTKALQKYDAAMERYKKLRAQYEIRAGGGGAALKPPTLPRSPSTGKMRITLPGQIPPLLVPSKKPVIHLDRAKMLKEPLPKIKFSPSPKLNLPKAVSPRQ